MTSRRRRTARIEGPLPKYDVHVEFYRDNYWDGGEMSDDSYTLTGRLDQVVDEDQIKGTGNYAGTKAAWSCFEDSSEYGKTEPFSGPAELNGVFDEKGMRFWASFDCCLALHPGDFLHPVPPEGDTWTVNHEGDFCDGGHYKTVVTYTITPLSGSG